MVIKKKRTNHWLGKKHSEESKRKMSEAKKGKISNSPRTEFKKGKKKSSGQIHGKY